MGLEVYFLPGMVCFPTTAEVFFPCCVSATEHCIRPSPFRLEPGGALAPPAYHIIPFSFIAINHGGVPAASHGPWFVKARNSKFAPCGNGVPRVARERSINTGASVMSKEKAKKPAEKSLKEKRREKKAKKNGE
ncbi:MAG: hypothetical protein WCY11_18095 [Novosphingobium sp.]